LAPQGNLPVSLRQLRAPRESGAVLAEPPLAETEHFLHLNRQRLALSVAEILGRPWPDLRRQAQRAAVASARDYHRRAGEPVPDYGDTSLLMAGHQPELFHPGVWVKNFALCGLARLHGLTPLNLIVDNDSVKTTALRLPALRDAGSASLTGAHQFESCVTASVAYDFWTGEVPYEERTVADEAQFANFAERAMREAAGWPFVPLLPAFWLEARRQAERTALLGERLVGARRVFERRWGCDNLEVPVSSLARNEPFAWFTCHLLVNLSRFHATYNECLHAYRRQYGIRSRHHPVPELAREGDWLELPLWAWEAGQARRGRLMARRAEAAIELRVGHASGPALAFRPGSEFAGLVAAWRDLERRGLRIRPRALTNTLYARLFLADLFIHGLGGGKYDELTDAIIRRFYGFEPPHFLTLSATLLLPLPSFPAQAADRHRLVRELRDVHCNPQRHLGEMNGEGPEGQELAAAKRAWIARQPPDWPQRRDRFQLLRSLTQRLRPYMAKRQDQLRRELERCEEQLRSNAILQRRDYAFCLYPEVALKAFCTPFLR
jgi:hypothetical protein